MNWHLGMVSCISNSGQFLLDSSPCVNFIIPVVATKTSHSGDENWGLEADPGVRGIRILMPIWITQDGLNTGLTVERCRKIPWGT